MTETADHLDSLLSDQEDDVDFVAATGGANPLEDAVRELTEGQAGPTLEAPLDGPVSLPGGLRRMVPGSSPPKFETITKVWVTELDGFAEERIDRARMQGDMQEFISEIVTAGVTKIGDRKPTATDLQDLLAGDQQWLLLQISRVTYGDEIEYKNAVCQNCLETFDVTITKDEEIPVVRLDDPEDSYFEFTTKKGRVLHVHVPTVSEQTRAFSGETGAEANSLLLGQCVDEFMGDADAARRLTVTDRKRLLDELGKRTPGPRYTGVKFLHEPGCGKEVRLTVTLDELFPGL